MEKQTAVVYQLTSDQDSGRQRDSTVLHSIPGNPRRHKPLAKHSRLNDNKTPTIMYALEPRTGQNLSKSPTTKHEDKHSKKRTNLTPAVFLTSQVVSQPVLYNVAGSKPAAKPERQTTQNESPALYSIVQRPRRQTMDLTPSDSSTDTDIIKRSSIIYTVLNNPLAPPPTKNRLEMPVSNFYSISSTPARTSRGTQVDSTPPFEPVPVLYTVVSEPSTPRTNDTRNHLQTTDTSTRDDNVVIYVPTNQVYSPRTPQPTVYTLVGKSESPPEITITRSPPNVAHNRPRPNRDIEPIKESPIEEIEQMITPDPKHSSPKIERNRPKPEPIFIPIDDEPRKHMHYQPTILPTHRSSSQGFRTQKPHQGRKLNQTPLPVVSNTRQEQRPRINLQESRYRVDRYFPNGATKSTSMERNQVRTNSHSKIWAGEQQAHTDDDEMYEPTSSRLNRSVRLVRHRQPWIPVW